MRLIEPRIPLPSLPAIDAVQTLQVRVPRLASNRITTSYATLPDAHHTIVRIQAGGLEGLGEAPAERWWTGEDAASVANAIERYLEPAVLGATGIREAARRMEGALAGNPYAKAAIEMALWDVLGKAAGLPLHLLLGGGSEVAVPVKYVIGMTDDPEHARAEVDHGRSLGFTCFKVKVGGQLEPDLRRVAAIADLLGGGERVGVDANAGWSAIQARTALRPLEELGVAFLEQPLAASDLAGMAELAGRSTIPIVAHESIFTLRDGLDALRARAAHVWALTPSTHGGLLSTIDLLALARAGGIGCLLGSTVELGIATAFMAQIGAAYDELARGSVPSDVIGPLYHEHDLLAAPVRIEGGFAYAPSGPGLGVELDGDAVERYGGGAWR